MEIKQYLTPAGRAPVHEFIMELDKTSRFEVLALLRRMEGGEILSMPHSRSLTSMAKGLFELRIRESGGIIRVFYYTKRGASIYLVHALWKKSRVIPEKDKSLILKRLREIERI